MPLDIYSNIWYNTEYNVSLFFKENSKGDLPMLLAFAIILIFGLAVGGEYLTGGGRHGFKRCVFSLRFLKKFTFQLVASVLILMAKAF